MICYYFPYNGSLTPIGENNFLDVMYAAGGGGASAYLTGGKFSDGARTAGFVRLFNYQSHRKKWPTVSKSIDGSSHEYTIRSFICSESTTGSNSAYADNVYNYVNNNDVPFSGDDLGTGSKMLMRGISIIGSLPIEHGEYPRMRISINITQEGHDFHPGTVTHSVNFENGDLYYQVKGTGTGSNPGFNNFVGVRLFRSGVQEVSQRFGI